MDQEKELQQLKNRFRDLADKSFNQNMFTFTGFLGMSEQDVFYRMSGELRHAGYELNGGFEMAERQMVRFGNAEELGYEVPFPIVCIHIEPLMRKFADQLSHRDFLGALMNLGIERSTIGDIRVQEKEAYLFCQDTIAPFICENLDTIKHTHVKCTVTENVAEIALEEPQREVLQVASIRIDAVISKVYNLSRGDCLEYFKAGKVFASGRMCENNSKMLHAGDVVNVRGFGKFIFEEELGETKKGKKNVAVAVFR